MIVKIVNAEGGSDARYDVSRMTAEERAQFDGEGRPLGSNNPGQWTWTPGLPGARGGNDASHMGQAGGGLAVGGAAGGGGGSDAYYQQVKSMLQAQSAAEAANTKAQIQKALIGFGLVPEGFQDKLGALDDLTKSLIAKNTESGISQYARLLEAKKDVMRSLIGRLSSSGLRRSGAKGAKLRKGQLDYDRLLSDSLQELLGNIGTAYGNYTSNEQNRQMQLLAALQNSQGNYYSGEGSTTQPTSTSPTSGDTGVYYPYYSSAVKNLIPSAPTTAYISPFVRSAFSGTSGAVTAPSSGSVAV